MSVVLRLTILLTALAGAGDFVLAQEALPPLSSLEPLPSGAGGEYVGPPLDYFDLDSWMAVNAGPTVPRDDWSWQLLPDGILYRAYLASTKEARISTTGFWEQDDGQLWDSTLGGRMGLVRFGTCDNAWPQGWQVDIEGAADVRLDPEEQRDVRSTDYRFGVPLTYAYGRNRLKLGYYHHCSHLGDEFIEDHPNFRHLNFVRDAITLGYAYYYTDNLRLYGEVGYGFYCDVSREWELQFGFDYSPARPTGIRGAPFVAMHGHLREELNYSGNFVAQAGWAWRGKTSHLLRTGLHYYNGLNNQFSFFRDFQQQVGVGLWYDY